MMIRGLFYDTPDDVRADIDDWTQEQVRLAKEWAIEYIADIVPKRTGRLREALTDYIRDQWDEYNPNPFLDLYAPGVPYADEIIGEPAHAGTWYEHSGKLAYANGAPVYLDDPAARVDWLESFWDNITLEFEIEFGMGGLG